MKIAMPKKILSSKRSCSLRFTGLHVFNRWFWQVVKEMPMDKQRRLLLFVTGSDRMPIGGLAEMTFKIAKMTSNRCKIDDLYVSREKNFSLNISCVLIFILDYRCHIHGMRSMWSIGSPSFFFSF